MARKKRPEGTRAPNGASSIYYSEYDQKWHGRVTVGVKDDGSPDRRHVKRDSESAVIRAVRDLEKQRDSGKVRKPGRSWTVEKWLAHWLEHIISQSVRRKTADRYRTDIVEYLIPGLGAHRIDKLEPEHIERLYATLRKRKPPLAPASIYHVHATLRTSLNEAVRRRHIVENPALIARPPQLVEPEIEPLTVAEAKRILDVATRRPNGVRFAIALGLGLRQGEALGLRWANFDPNARTWKISHALQRQTWQHGCDDPRVCSAKRHKTKPCPDNCRQHTRECPPPCPPECVGHARHCPQREGGGLVLVETKSRSGLRVVSVPQQLVAWLERHRRDQQAQREHAGDLWTEGGWAFTQPTGKPLDPRADYREWRELLDAADVRPARLHDARHTAATMLMVLKVPVRAMMDMMGWSEASMATRYTHVPDELRAEYAQQLGGLLWAAEASPDAGPDGLSDAQRTAIRQLAETLPEPWRGRLVALLDGEDPDGPAAAMVTA